MYNMNLCSKNEHFKAIKYPCIQITRWMMKNSTFTVSYMCLAWPCASKALSFVCKFVFAFQYNPICGDIHSGSRYGNKHNTSLHLWPPSSSSSLWMQCNNGGEQGRGRKIASLFRYLLMVHKLKDSRFNSDNKSVRKPTCKMLCGGLFRRKGFSSLL